MSWEGVESDDFRSDFRESSEVNWGDIVDDNQNAYHQEAMRPTRGEGVVTSTITEQQSAYRLTQQPQYYSVNDRPSTATINAARGAPPQEPHILPMFAGWGNQRYLRDYPFEFQGSVTSTVKYSYQVYQREPTPQAQHIATSSMKIPQALEEHGSMQFSRRSPSPSVPVALEAVPVPPELKLKANIIDWDGIPDSTQHHGRRIDVASRQGSEKSFVSGCASINSSNVSERLSFSSDVSEKHEQTCRSSSPNPRFDVTLETHDDNWAKLEERKRRYGGSLSLPAPTSARSAIEMPLDELILRNNITYAKPKKTPWSTSDDKQGECSTGTSSSNIHSTLGRKRSYTNAFTDESQQQPTSCQTFYKGQKEGNACRMVVIDGSSVGFEYGDNFHFDWKGIHLCVQYLVDSGYTDVVAIVPEDRVLKQGMSKNEHLINHLKKGRYLWKSWEGRCEKLFTLKIAHAKNAVIISNNVWKVAKNVPTDLKYLKKDRTFQFAFISAEKVQFSNNLVGHSLEQVMHTA